jgi:hypothetical protein
MASRHPFCSVATCPQKCRPPPQQPASAGGWHIKAGAIQLNSSGRQHEHMHTFGFPVFALQNALASGNTLPRWSPRARLGLNLGPSSNHARNVYLVLNLITGCVSPQYHCKFNDFFETTRHGGPDVSGTICWQQLAGLMQTNQILSNIARPTGRTTTSNEMLSDMPLVTHVPSEEFSVTEIDYNL